MECFFRSCCVSLFVLLGAGSAAADDLWDIYLRALENDPQYAAAQAQRQAGQEARVQGRAGLLPQIGLGAGASHMNSRPDGADDHDYGRFTWQVQLTQPLYRPQNLIASDQGELRSQSSDVSLLLARQQLILRVAEAYFNVLNAQDKLASVRQLRTAASEQLELATTSFELGTVTVTDVHEARSRFDLADAQVIQAESALDVELHRLTEIIGMPAGDLATLRQEAVFSPPRPERQQDWADAAALNGLDVELKRIDRTIAGLEAERARAGHKPTLDLVASRGLEHRQTTYTEPRTASTMFGVQFNLPLYEGGSISSKVREMAALLTRSEADLENARRNASLLAKQAYLGVTQGLAQIRALEAALVSSESSLESNRLGYKIGVRINIDVLNALTQLADTQQQLAQARYSTLLSQLQLQAAVGTLDEGDLLAVNRMLLTPRAGSQIELEQQEKSTPAAGVRLQLSQAGEETSSATKDTAVPRHGRASGIPATAAGGAVPPLPGNRE